MSNGTEAALRRNVRKWVFRVVISIGVVCATLVLVRLAFIVWVEASIPSDAPHIAFSIDDTWLFEIGVRTSTYEQAIARAGGRLIEFQADDAGTPPDAEQISALFDEHQIAGLLLTGGGDVDPKLYGGDADSALEVDAERDAFEIALIHEARQRGLPILGVCRGIQILNVALGGTLQSIRSDEALKEAHFTFSGHAVELEADSKLAGLLAAEVLESVQSFHGQAVRDPAPDLVPVAHGPGEIVEALESINPDEWIFAVQWHPELTLGDAAQDRLFEIFVNSTR